MLRSFWAQRVRQRRRLARRHRAAAMVELLEDRLVLSSVWGTSTLVGPAMPSPGSSSITATVDSAKLEATNHSIATVESVAVRDGGPLDSSIVSAGLLSAVSGPVYSNLDEGSGYQPSPMSTGILGFDDYDSVNDEDINLTQIQFVGGVANAGDELRFDFYDATYTNLVASITASFPDAGNFAWNLSVGTPVVIPDQGVLEISTVDGADGEWSASDAAPTVGIESGGFGSLSGSGLSHKFELTNSLPDPDDQISEAIATSVGSSETGEIAIPSDVDMYSFSVTGGQRVGFDIDSPGSDLDSYVRLFNSAGIELDLNDDGNNAGPAPEDDAEDSYLEFTFSIAGTYYLGISGFFNDLYDPLNGSGDNESLSTGTYVLTLSDVTPPPPTGDDFGDAPAPYPTLIADNGAQHTLTGSFLFLGTRRDPEGNGQPQVHALGDDNAGAASDEDGIIFTDLLLPGTTADITVNASDAGGVLNAWIDWNQNGNWLDAGEQVFTNQPLSAGLNVLSIAVPATAELGLTMSRFRLSTSTGLAPTGAAADGEVEDHQVTVQASGTRINWVNRGQSGDRFESTFGAAANLARSVVDAVIAAWERVITNFNQPGGGDQIDVAISMFNSGTGLGAGTDIDTFDAGFPTFGSIGIGRGLDITGDGNGDGVGYFLDPTPLDNSEFAGTLNQGAFTGNAQAGSPATGLSDFFTVVNAEVAHVIGLFLAPALANNPLNGTVTDTGIADDAEGGGLGNYFVFDGPSVTHLFTSNNGGPGGNDFEELVHTAGPPNGSNQPVSFNSAYRGNRELVGANDSGNAVYEFGRRYVPGDVLALFFQDAYEYEVTLPQTFGTMYAILNENTGELLIRGGLSGSEDEISLSIDGSDLEVSVDIGNDIAGTGPNGDDSEIAAFVSRFPLSSVTSVTIEAGGGNDQFTIALLPDVPITVDGGNPAFPNGGIGDELAFDVTGYSTGTFIDNGDGSGSLSEVAFGAIAWSEIEILTPPAFISPATVTGTNVNGAGNPNRSGIRELTFSFSDPVTIDAAASLSLFNHTTGLSVDLSGAALVNNGTAAVSWDLSGVALADGRYTAELSAAAATPGLAQTFAAEFFKLAGDVSGNAAVNLDDFSIFGANFSTSGAAYKPGDVDGDGTVNLDDFSMFGANFSNSLPVLAYDFGDAPDSANFPTTLANNGARHVITGNDLYLGASRDGEPDGVSSGDASGDDAAGSDDENGLTIGDLERGTSVGLTVTANVPTSAVLNGWIDFNGDGDWLDAGEQVFTNVPLDDGSNNLNIDVPADAALGATIARFRLTETGGYSYTGLAANGEVEDYQLEVTEPPQAVLALSQPTSSSRVQPSFRSAAFPSLLTSFLPPMALSQLSLFRSAAFPSRIASVFDTDSSAVSAASTLEPDQTFDDIGDGLRPSIVSSTWCDRMGSNNVPSLTAPVMTIGGYGEP